MTSIHEYTVNVNEKKKRIVSLLLVLCLVLVQLPVLAVEAQEEAVVTGLSITVDGVTYTEGNVIIRPNSTVSFTVMGENLDNANQQQIIDTPFAYLPLHSIDLEDNTTYPYVTYSSVFQGGTNYRITYTNDAWATTIPTDIYVTYQEGPSLWTLTADTDTQLSLTEDLYVDLNGFDLSGSIALNGYKVYGIDSTTNSYTCDNIVSSTTDFKNTLTLRLENFDIGNYGQTPVNACVSMTLLDGTVLESFTVSYSMRQMIEMLNDNTQNYQTTALQKVAQMILNNQPMETWQVDNILAVLN